MSRRGLQHLVLLGAVLCANLVCGFAAGAVRAQESAPAASAAQPADAPAEASAEANAAIARRLLQGPPKSHCGVPGADGAIIVCGGREASEKERLPLRDELESAHATKDGLPRAPNVSSLPDCSRGCIGLGGVPPPMYYFDLTALPEAPPDSDADRIARGEMKAP